MNKNVKVKINVKYELKEWQRKPFVLNELNTLKTYKPFPKAYDMSSAEQL